MLIYLLFGLVALLLILMGAWAVTRARRLRRAAKAREEEALAIAQAGGGAHPESIMATEVGMSSRLPAAGGIEVAEMVDVEQLLAGEPAQIAQRARAQLEEPTNIDASDWLPTLPPPRTTTAAASTMNSTTANTAGEPSPLLKQLQKDLPRASHQRADDFFLAARTDAAIDRLDLRDLSPELPRDDRMTPYSAGARAQTPPAPAAAKPSIYNTPPAPRAPAAAPQPQAKPQPQQPQPQPEVVDVPLRELVLAWFEARGYKRGVASSAVRPIELVLRHKSDPSRVYAFVVETERVTGPRVEELIKLARSVGLMRLLIAADRGVEHGPHELRKGVRIFDRATMDSEFRRLDLSVAAKIIAVARRRAEAPATQ